MVLCFDIGNTDIDVGVFENDRISRTFHIDYTKGQQSWRYIRPIREALEKNGIDIKQVEGSVLCSVVHNTTQGVFMALRDILGKAPLVFSNDEWAQMSVKVGNPQEVGVDIVAACLAVKKKYSLPAIVIDMGTATTVTAMDEDGDLLGVSIITGVIVSLQALARRTGLPIDESLTPPRHAIGTDTPMSIASGTVLGSAYCMDGMINAFEKEMGKTCHIYATGGISKAIMPLCRRKAEINNNLLLEGLYVYYKNATKEKEI